MSEQEIKEESELTPEETNTPTPEIHEEGNMEENATLVLETELLELKDRHIRLQAEFDNFRRRTMKEKTELIKNGGEQVLKNIIPLIDDLDRAMSTFSNINDEDPLKQGIALIHAKFQDFLKQNDLHEIDALEKDFDTDLHEALTKIPAPTPELKGKVVDVISKGYMLNDKVVRFSKVVVGE